MQFKSALALFALPLLAAAIPAAEPIPQELSRRDCDTGSIQCCNSTQNSTLTTLTQLGGLLGLSLPAISGLIGLACSPITLVGASGTSCSAQPVCCTNNSFSGLIALGCSPINLNL